MNERDLALLCAGHRLLRPDVLALEAAGGPEGRGCDLRLSLSLQNPGGQRLHPEDSVAGQGPPGPHQPLPRWGYTLPHHFARQVLQGPPQ